MYYDALRKAYIDTEDGTVVLHEENPPDLYISEVELNTISPQRDSQNITAINTNSSIKDNSNIVSGGTICRPPSHNLIYQQVSERLAAIEGTPESTEAMTINTSSNKDVSDDRLTQLERDLYAIHVNINNDEEIPAPPQPESAERQTWDDWSFARTLQAMEFEITDAMIDREHGDFNEKELRASKSCRRQLLTLSFFICLVQIGLLIAMIQDDGYDKNNPVIGPHAYTMVRYGAKEAGLIVVKDEWWRLISSIMLHGGIWHIIPNVAIQLRIGGYLNLVYGTPKFLFIYLISGIFGGMMSCIFLPEAVGVGSSGALLGLLTSWLVWIVFRWRKIPPECRGQRNCQMGVVLVATAITLGTSFSPNVDWAAHFGGAVQGCLWGLVLLSSELDHHGNQFAIRVVAGLIAVGLVAFSIYYMIVLLDPPTDNFDYWEEHDDWDGS